MGEKQPRRSGERRVGLRVRISRDTDDRILLMSAALGITPDDIVSIAINRMVIPDHLKRVPGKARKTSESQRGKTS